jgi:hypothetical protein
MDRHTHRLRRLPWLAGAAALSLVLLVLGIEAAQADQPGAGGSAGSAAQTSNPSTGPTEQLVDAPSSEAPPTPDCPTAVTITAIDIQQELAGGQVVVHVAHDGQGCPDAKPATLHIHQNLLSFPHAGSDPVHQSNVNLTIGHDSDDTVLVDLMTAVPGMCFVQVDASSGSIRRGRFFATATCPAESTPPPSSSSPPPSSSSPPPSSSSPPPSSSSPPPSSSSPPAPTHTRASHAIGGVATSRVAAQRPLAVTGSHTGAMTGIAALLLGVGTMLCYAARRPRRH